MLRETVVEETMSNTDCFRVEIFVSDPDDEDSDHYLVAPFRSMGSKSFQFEVI